MAASRNIVNKASKEQIKIIYTLGNELRLVDRMVPKDMLHGMVESLTRKEHITELTSTEAITVIDRLKGLMRGSKRANYEISPPLPPAVLAWHLMLK